MASLGHGVGWLFATAPSPAFGAGRARARPRASRRCPRDAVDALDVAIGQSFRVAAGVVATERGLQRDLAGAESLRRRVVAPAQDLLGRAQVRARLEGVLDAQPELPQVGAVDL